MPIDIAQFLKLADAAIFFLISQVRQICWYAVHIYTQYDYRYIMSTPEKLGGNTCQNHTAIGYHVNLQGDHDSECLKGTFKVIPLPPEKFLKVAGTDQLPENYRKLLSDRD